MKAVVQRVLEASVTVSDRLVGEIGPGLLVLVCAEVGDTELQAQRLVDKLVKLRIFADEQGKMNRSVQDLDGAGAHGGLLLVSQFTLAGDVWSGNRPSFAQAAPAAQGRELFDRVVTLSRQRHSLVQTGEFGADMRVRLINDGPVTLVIQTP